MSVEAAEARRKALFVDDEPHVLQGLSRMLRGMRGELEMTFLGSGREALEHMARERVDILVCDLHMPGVRGAEVMKQAMARHPHCIRIVLSGQADREQSLRSVAVAHQYLPKPCDADTLKAVLRSAGALSDLIGHDALRRVVARVGTLPSRPAVYGELLDALGAPDSNAERVGRIVSRDPAMTAKLLQIVNSAFVGLASHVSSPTRAVQLLGFDTVKALVLGMGLFAQFDRALFPRFSMEWLWDHSLRVGLAARAITLLEGCPRSEGERAFIVGLLHDIGKLLLMTTLPDAYEEVIRLAVTSMAAPHRAEQHVFGIGHAEVGAFLLGIWGLPGPIIEGVAFHHQPGRSTVGGMDALAAVHAADVFEHREHSQEREIGTYSLDKAWLTGLGLMGKESGWLAAARTSFESERQAPDATRAAPR